MAGFTNYYVDPLNGTDDVVGDRGSVIGNPWKSRQYAYDHITRDAANGDQINHKSDQAPGIATTTDDVMTTAEDLSTYGEPTEAAPLIDRGYSSALNDGGIGGLDGDGTYSVIGTKVPFHSIVDMHCHNTGSNMILYLYRGSAINCEIDNTTDRGLKLYQNCRVINCHIHNIDLYCINCESAYNQVLNCYIKNGTNKANYGIYAQVYTNVFLNNIISLDDSSTGIYMAGDHMTARGNTIFSDGGTGSGMYVNATYRRHSVVNNIVAGFSGGGGAGINFLNAPGESVDEFGHNAVYNCTTNYKNLADSDFICNFGDNEELSESPFMKTGSDTFANRFNYFAPRAVGNVWGGAYPSGCRMDKGAVQHSTPQTGATALQWAK